VVREPVGTSTSARSTDGPASVRSAPAEASVQAGPATPSHARGLCPLRASRASANRAIPAAPAPARSRQLMAAELTIDQHEGGEPAVELDQLNQRRVTKRRRSPRPEALGSVRPPGRDGPGDGWPSPRGLAGDERPPGGPPGLRAGSPRHPPQLGLALSQAAIRCSDGAVAARWPADARPSQHALLSSSPRAIGPQRPAGRRSERGAR